MIITNPYNPSQGLMIISSVGSQKYTERLDSFSQILTNFYVSTFNNNNKYCIDSCWESGNIYYANYNEGYVKKIQYDGTEISTLNLNNPFMVSVVQNSASMNSIVTYPPQDDLGCWIADKGSGKIIKTDKDLNIVAELNGVSNPVCIMSNIDGGCYIVEYHTTPVIGGNLIKVSSTANIIAIKDYTSFSPAVTHFVDMVVDANGKIWFCANDKIYNLSYNSTLGQIVQNFVIDPFVSIGTSSSSSEIEEVGHIGAIDVDRNDINQHLYVTGGNNHQSFVLKYNGNTLVANEEYYDIGFPYILKVIQGMGSDSLYILEDSAKWDDYGYGSSSSSSTSSSSSYIENWSSSTSSSSSTEVKSSSSSSSSTSSSSSSSP